MKWNYLFHYLFFYNSKCISLFQAGQDCLFHHTTCLHAFLLKRKQKSPASCYLSFYQQNFIRLSHAEFTVLFLLLDLTAVNNNMKISTLKLPLTLNCSLLLWIYFIWVKKGCPQGTRGYCLIIVHMNHTFCYCLVGQDHTDVSQEFFLCLCSDIKCRDKNTNKGCTKNSGDLCSLATILTQTSWKK